MTATRKSVDIIIPIYNAFDDLKKCIESIKKYTDLSLDRVICINDCSTDERIVPYLEEQSKPNKGIYFINNEKNKGFSNNVNKGMSQSDERDVILLNSDTIVTERWVDKIYACAYSKSEIGTVTPLSNCATLCSVPLMCQDNKMPENITIDEFAELIEHCSLNRYPRITVAVGFCMFIKRETIKDTGFFDANTFEKGYGEENDFCNRAEQLGYIHVMCDNTFIYHKGTASFAGEEKKKLIESHVHYLEEKYPEQMRKNHLYCVNNPDQYIRDNINIYLKLHNNKPNILMVSHLDFHPQAEGNVGGTQFHIRDLAMNMKSEYNIFVMARDSEYIRLTYYTDKDSKTMLFYVGKLEKYYRFRDSRIAEICANILDAFKIQMVHIHHVDRLSYDIYYEADVRNIPIISSIHDYNYVCPNYNLVNNDNICCYGVSDISACGTCLHEKIGLADTVDYISKWRNECRKALKKAEILIAPSDSVKEIFLKTYPENVDKIKVIGHATELTRIEDSPIDISGLKKTTNMLVRYDVFSFNKGVLSLEGWSVFGNIDCTDMDIYVEIMTKSGNQYIKCFKNSRVDVAKQFLEPRYIDSGFSIKTYINEAEPQTIKIRLIMRYNNEYYTDGEIKDIVVNGKDSKNSKKKIIFLGGLSVNKGAALAYDVMTHADQDKYEWYVLGSLGYEPLCNLTQENVYMLGKYQIEELPDIIKGLNIDLACIWSICPETFCYTLSEAVLCGLPVLGCNIGAVGERIKKNGYGWLIDPRDDYNKIIEKITNIFADVSDYEQKKLSVTEYKSKTIMQMVDEYKCIYKNMEAAPMYFTPNNDEILVAWNNAICRKNDWIDDDLEDIVKIKKDQLDRYKTIEHEINQIKRSRSYRYTEKLMRILGRR